MGTSHGVIRSLCASLYDRRLDDVAVVQVGANDGKIADPLTRFIAKGGWRALLIEPVPTYAAELRARYRGYPDVEVVECAVDAAEGRRTMYVVDAAHVPADKPWWKGLASFHKASVTGHQVPENAIVEVGVPTAPLSAIMRTENFPACDVLCIDVEGHEPAVLDTFDFERVRPALVAFEAKHLRGGDYARIESKLRLLGYDVNRLRPDAVAVHRGSELVRELAGAAA